MEVIPAGLLSTVADRYGLAGRAGPLASGVSASSLWRLDSVPPVLVRVSRHHKLEDLYRTCRVARGLSRFVPEAIPPLIGGSGEVAFLWDGQPVTVWPFVDGQPLVRHDPAQLRRAARLLARLHQAGRTLTPGVGDGQIPGNENAESAAALLPDPELDEWLRSWPVTAAAEPMGWMHGDFFWCNILCRQGEIVGLVDWDEAWCGQLIIELAWSAWEFGKSAHGDALLPHSAAEFLAVYRESGPVQPSSALIPIIRERLRRDIAFFRRIGAEGYEIDLVDEQAKFAAFESLRHVSLPV